MEIINLFLLDWFGKTLKEFSKEIEFLEIIEL